jgi:argininosuccinate lyase
VLSGIPFRDAYKRIGVEIEQGKFTYSTKVNHTHEGSIGNLCNDKISEAFDKTLASFEFEKVKTALEKLISNA